MTQEPNESPKTSVYAIVAFVSCFGALMPVILLILPFVFAIMALSEIRKSNGAIKGKGLAIAAMVIPIAAGILLVATVFALPHHHPKAMDIGCANNLKMIRLSMQMYAEDNDDYLPDSLENSYIQEAVGSDKTFVCPYCRRSGEKYVLLPSVGGKKLKDFDNPKETPVIICRHHRKKDNILYLDGHVQEILKDSNK